MKTYFDAGYVYTGTYTAGTRKETIVMRPCGVLIEKDYQPRLFTWGDCNTPEKLKAIISEMNGGLPVELALVKGSRYIDIVLGRA